VRIAALGAGPAGLYASLLLKMADPSREITVYEQNPADATYGWGVVFSDTTLAEFREADPRSYEAITERFVTWDAIDIRYGGALVRAEGQPFAGISRRELLRILQERCREVGVDLRFEERIEDLGPLAHEHDLVMAADGVHSVARRRDVFGTREHQGAARYIWFGVDVPLDSFTFSFREHPAGLFQAHAYPFDGTTSTFIIEAHQDAWRAVGLDRASVEDSIAFGQSLFADDLRGRPLRSNNSKWISFVTVRNRTWRSGNVVLLGDAAHTAHFSIGSGTKLAMEDAIALAGALDRHGDRDAALRDYEAERRPRVERFQEAADQSREYFEQIPRYRGMEPLQFAFYLLTRSGRIDYTNLRMRDPALVEAVDAWFAARTEAGPTLAAPPAFHPLRLGTLEVPRRLAVEVRAARAAEGVPDEATVARMVEAARDGPGLVLAGPVAVTPDGRRTPVDPGCWGADHEEAWPEVVDALRAAGDAAIGLTLAHAGPRGSMRPRQEGVDRPLREGGWPLLAASALPYGPGIPAPRAATDRDMAEVAAAFAAAAERAARAGVDLLLVDMARGGLLASFLSPLTNRRDDGFGGDAERRMRFPLEVVAAVREAWPRDRPLGAAITADDWAPGGADPDHVVAVSGMLRDAAVDLIRPLAGQSVWRSVPRYGPGFLAVYADRIRNEAGVPTLVGGGIETVDQVNTLVAAGRADLALLERRSMLAPAAAAS
jgi:anthraniloyl-CoA monooxygenase